MPSTSSANDTRQVLQVVFGQVIANAQLDGCHRGGFADGAGKQNKGQLNGTGFEQSPGIQGRESWQAVVGQNNVKGLLGDGLVEIRERIDARDRKRQLVLLKSPANQLMVKLGVLKVQNIQALERVLRDSG